MSVTVKLPAERCPAVCGQGLPDAPCYIILSINADEKAQKKILSAL